jgi:hypothetical protein
MTIQELFKNYPLSPKYLADKLMMCKQQMNQYKHSKPISKANIKRINEYINQLGKELSKIKLE